MEVKVKLGPIDFRGICSNCGVDAVRVEKGTAVCFKCGYVESSRVFVVDHAMLRHSAAGGQPTRLGSKIWRENTDINGHGLGAEQLERARKLAMYQKQSRRAKKRLRRHLAAIAGACSRLQLSAQVRDDAKRVAAGWSRARFQTRPAELFDAAAILVALRTRGMERPLDEIAETVGLEDPLGWERRLEQIVAWNAEGVPKSKPALVRATKCGHLTTQKWAKELGGWHVQVKSDGNGRTRETWADVPCKLCSANSRGLVFEHRSLCQPCRLGEARG